MLQKPVEPRQSNVFFILLLSFYCFFLVSLHSTQRVYHLQYKCMSQLCAKKAIKSMIKKRNCSGTPDWIVTWLIEPRFALPN